MTLGAPPSDTHIPWLHIRTIDLKRLLFGVGVTVSVNLMSSHTINSFEELTLHHHRPIGW